MTELGQVPVEGQNENNEANAEVVVETVQAQGDKAVLDAITQLAEKLASVEEALAVQQNTQPVAQKVTEGQEVPVVEVPDDKPDSDEVLSLRAALAEKEAELDAIEAARVEAEKAEAMRTVVDTVSKNVGLNPRIVLDSSTILALLEKSDLSEESVTDILSEFVGADGYGYLRSNKAPRKSFSVPSGHSNVTREQYLSMSYSERAEWKKNNIDQWQALFN